MKKQYTVWLLAAMVFTIAMFFSCAEGDVEVEHKDVLPEEEIREQIALEGRSKKCIDGFRNRRSSHFAKLVWISFGTAQDECINRKEL